MGDDLEGRRFLRAVAGLRNMPVGESEREQWADEKEKLELELVDMAGRVLDLREEADEEHSRSVMKTGQLQDLRSVQEHMREALVAIEKAADGEGHVLIAELARGGLRIPGADELRRRRSELMARIMAEAAKGGGDERA